MSLLYYAEESKRFSIPEIYTTKRKDLEMVFLIRNHPENAHWLWELHVDSRHSKDIKLRLSGKEGIIKFYNMDDQESMICLLWYDNMRIMDLELLRLRELG